MQIFNQIALIDSINLYLKHKKRPLKLIPGYCHGLALFWLYHMYHHKEQQFYDLTQNMIHCAGKGEFDAIEEPIEKFIAYIEWLQNSRSYIKTFNQLDIEKLLEIPREFLLSFLFTPSQLEFTLEKIIQNEKMICISSPTHSIGLYKRNDVFYVYDPNDITGVAQLISDKTILKTHLINCLFRRGPVSTRYPLQISIACKNPASVNKLNLLNELRHYDSNLDEPGLEGLTNLYLACECGDHVTAAWLLSLGANPNIVTKQDWTPLQISALRGYQTIINLLLEHGANINTPDKLGRTALYIAVKNGHEGIVMELLKRGASPSIGQGKFGPISAAIEQHDWHLLIILLNHVNDLNLLNKHDRKKLQESEGEIYSAYETCRDLLTTEKKEKLNSLFNRTDNMKTNQHHFFSSWFARASSAKEKKPFPERQIHNDPAFQKSKH